MTPRTGGLLRCPTGCGRTRRPEHLMCRHCWAEVPGYMQRAVYAAWRRYQCTRDNDDLGAYLAAKEAALASIK